MVKKIIYSSVALLFVMLALTFTLKNTEPVIVNYYFGIEWQGTLSLVILTSFVTGVFAGYLVNFASSVIMRRKLVKARRDVQQAEQEVANLRALPIKDAL